jgi:hypothetical protein
MTATLKYLYDLKSEAASQLTVDQLISVIINGYSSTVGLYDPTKTYVRGDKTGYIDSNGLIHTLKCIADSTTGNPLKTADWVDFSILDELAGIENNYVMLTATQPTSILNRVWVQQASTDTNGIVHGLYSYNTSLNGKGNSFTKVYLKNGLEDVNISKFTAVSNLDAIPAVNYTTGTLQDLVQYLDAYSRKLARDKYDAANVTSTATANKVLALNSVGQLPATAIRAVGDEFGTAITSYIKGITITGNSVTFTTGAGVKTTMDVSDTKVTNTLATTTKAYLTGTTSAVDNTGTQVFDTGVYLGETAGSLYATTFYGKLVGNADSATTATTATTATSCSGNAVSATKATQDGNGNVITTFYTPVTQGLQSVSLPTPTGGVSASYKTHTGTLTKADGTTSSLVDCYALYNEVWDTDGHLVSPAGWKFYITNESI